MPSPNVDEDLSEGLKLKEDENGRYSLTRVFHCSNLVGASPVEIFAQALTLTSAAGAPAHTGGNIPAAGEVLTVNGHKLYVRNRDLDPFPPNSAGVEVGYTEANLSIAGYGPTIIEVGSTVEQGETEFDYLNLAKPFAQRTPIEVLWDKANDTPGAGAKKQTPRVPIFTGKAVRRYRRQQSVNPESLADAYVGRTNSAGWKGLAADQALCVGISGVNTNSGAGLWDCSFEFAVDKIGLFRQIARAVDPDTGLPVWLNAARVAAGNGLKEIIVQGRVDFNALAL
jgi:hypothetical protein